MKLIKFLPVDRQKKLFNQFCEREEQDQLTLWTKNLAIYDESTQEKIFMFDSTAGYAGCPKTNWNTFPLADAT